MKIFGENFKWKILSVMLAILLWVYITEVQTTDITRTITDVPINITNINQLLEKKLSFVYPEDMVTSVKVKGAKEIVRKLTKDNFEVTANVGNINEVGENSVILRVNTLNVSNLGITTLNPAKLDFNIENLIQKDIDINVNFKGEATQGYIFDVISLSPEKLVVKGPESLTNTIARVDVNVELSTVTEDDIIVLKEFSIMNKEDENIINRPELIFDKANIQVEAIALKSKIVPIETSMVGEPAKGYEIKGKTLTPAQVIIVGKASEIAGIERVYTKPITISGTTVSHNVEAELENPTYIRRFVSTADSKTLVEKINVGLEIGRIE